MLPRWHNACVTPVSPRSHACVIPGGRGHFSLIFYFLDNHSANVQRIRAHRQVKKALASYALASAGTGVARDGHPTTALLASDAAPYAARRGPAPQGRVC